MSAKRERGERGVSRPVERVTRGVAVSLRGLAQAACVLLVATVAGMVVALALERLMGAPRG